MIWWKKNLIGIELTPSRLKVIKIEIREGMLRLNKQQTYIYTERTFYRIVEAMVDDFKLTCRDKIHLIANIPEVMVRINKYPKMPENELIQAIYWDIKKYFKEDEGFIYDYSFLSSDKKNLEQKVLIGYGAQKKLNYLVDAFKDYNLKVSSIDVAPMAIYSFLKLKQADEENLVSIYFGEEYLWVTVIYQQELSFIRLLKIEDTKHHVHDFITFIEDSIKYCHHTVGITFDKIYIGGYEAYVEAVYQYFCQRDGNCYKINHLGYLLEQLDGDFKNYELALGAMINEVNLCLKKKVKSKLI
jgi:hypothetical protein